MTDLRAELGLTPGKRCYRTSGLKRKEFSAFAGATFVLRVRRTMRALWKVEATDDDGFGDDVAVHGLQQFGLAGRRAETELGVQRKKFERVMVIGSGSGSAHSGIAGLAQIV